MKKYISTWFGIGIYDEFWYDIRYPILKNLTLESMKKIDDTTLNWCFFIDTDMPLKYRRILEKDIKGFNFNFNLVEINFYYEMVPYMKKYVNSTVECDDEVVLLMRFDADDIIKPDFFNMVEKKYNNNAENVLITYSKLWYMQLDTLNISETIRPFMALNMFLLTNDRNISMYEVDHPNMGSWAKKSGYQVIQIDEGNPYFIRTMFKDQDSNAYQYFENRCDFDNIKKLYDGNFYEDFGIIENNISRYVKAVNQEAKHSLKWDYNSYFVRKARIKNNEIENLKYQYKKLRKVANYKIISELTYDFSKLIEMYKNHNLIVVSQDTIAASHKISQKYTENLLKLNVTINDKENHRKAFFFYKFSGQNHITKVSNEPISLIFEINKLKINLKAVGFLQGNSSIIINDVDYSLKRRGLNFVVFDKNYEIIDCFNYDAYSGSENVNRYI